MRSKGWYFFFEGFSVVFSIVAIIFLIAYGIGGNPSSSRMIFLGVDVMQFRHVIATLLAFGLATAASVLAAHVAKSFGPAEYDELNRRFHKWAVVGINSIIFLTLGIVAAVLQNWLVVSWLGAAAALYVIFSTVIKVQPHSFGARLRSVVLVRLQIALSLSLILPNSLLAWLVTVLAVFVFIGAVIHLDREQKKIQLAVVLIWFYALPLLFLGVAF